MGLLMYVAMTIACFIAHIKAALSRKDNNNIPGKLVWRDSDISSSRSRSLFYRFIDETSKHARNSFGKTKREHITTYFAKDEYPVCIARYLRYLWLLCPCVLYVLLMYFPVLLRCKACMQQQILYLMNCICQGYVVDKYKTNFLISYQIQQRLHSVYCVHLQEVLQALDWIVSFTNLVRISITVFLSCCQIDQIVWYDFWQKFVLFFTKPFAKPSQRKHACKKCLAAFSEKQSIIW